MATDLNAHTHSTTDHALTRIPNPALIPCPPILSLPVPLSLLSLSLHPYSPFLSFPSLSLHPLSPCFYHFPLCSSFHSLSFSISFPYCSLTISVSVSLCIPSLSLSISSCSSVYSLLNLSVFSPQFYTILSLPVPLYIPSPISLSFPPYPTILYPCSSIFFLPVPLSFPSSSYPFPPCSSIFSLPFSLFFSSLSLCPFPPSPVSCPRSLLPPCRYLEVGESLQVV